MKSYCLLLPCLFSCFFAAATELPLSKAMVIRSSCTIKKAVYQLNGSDSLDRPLILVEGNNITVDFNGAELSGSNDKNWPNEYYGLAILVKGNNITIKNARVNGFKVGLMAAGCRKLNILNSNFSHNYRQKLHSTRLRESVSDWMSYHHNEQDEWLRYGAGIYLKDCKRPNITGNTITGGQCALMMVRTDSAMITNNDLSFNSGLGIGMYRSSHNSILNNKLDFNVRGYSHGIFNRGQDSAGILAFEQCNDNNIAFNNVTYGGDGFFLWAGQTTMDSGTGGCNDNTLYKNDFSFAPTNGVELTFSRNNIKENTILECDNGIWGGYSYNTEITGNNISGNRTGIAIEHGQDNYIIENKFADNKTAIRLWANKIEPSDWGYPKKRDTRSRNYLIVGNEFLHNTRPVNISGTDSLLICDIPDSLLGHFKFDSTVTNASISMCDVARKEPYIDIYKKMEKDNLLRRKLFNPSSRITEPGRKNIRITEWGPYDFRYPIIWLKDAGSSGKLSFEILGPKGSWKLKNSRDVSGISKSNGTFPAKLEAIKTGKDVLIELEYTGESFTDQFGKKQRANIPHSFSYADFDPGIQWNVKWFSWDAAHDPNKNYDLFRDTYNNTPFKSETAAQLDYTWWGAVGKNLPADSFATVATGSGYFPKGRYSLEVTADDLVKVLIDGKTVINFWDAKKYINDEDAQHDVILDLDGKHDIRVEHVENAGYATLQVLWKRL